jgi:HEAT repeat protein/uncharacterized protein YjbI with pentapeptide repeats
MTIFGLFLKKRLPGSLLLLLLTIGITVGQNATSLPTSGGAGGPAPASSPEKLDPEKLALEKEKLRLENEKLKIENTNSIRDPKEGRAWWNLIFTNLTFLSTVAVGLWALYRYFKGRKAELRNTQEERFEAVVKSLGSEQIEERISASVLLPTFLSPDYARFHEQVFNLAAGHLRAEAMETTPSTTTDIEIVQLASYPTEALTPVLEPTPVLKPSIIAPSPLAQGLANVFSKAYRLARDARQKQDSADATSITSQFLNAARVRLDGTYLANSDLRDAWLREASFQQANLTGALLTQAILEGSNFSGAVLKEAELVGANLKNVNFSGANLFRAALDGANLEGANFKYAQLPKVTMRGGSSGGADFEEADLTDAEFEGVDFSSIDSKSVNLQEASSLQGAVFKNVKGLPQGYVALLQAKGAKVFEEPVQTKAISEGVDDERAKKLVETVLYVQSFAQRTEAANELGHLDTPLQFSVQGLCNLLLRPSVEDRRIAAYTLKQIAESASEAVPNLCAALGDEDEQVRVMAAEALAAIGSRAVPKLIQSLRAPNAEVRRLAAYSLGTMGSNAAGAVFHLVAALKDANSLVRSRAAWALGTIRKATDFVVPNLIDLLKDPEQDVKLNAIKALESIGPRARKAVSGLIETLDDDDNAVRLHAAKALGSIGGASIEVVPDLIKAFKDENTEVAGLAVEAVFATGSEAIPFLTEALRDPSLPIRTRAADVLAKLAPV